MRMLVDGSRQDVSLSLHLLELLDLWRKVDAKLVAFPSEATRGAAAGSPNDARVKS